MELKINIDKIKTDYSSEINVGVYSYFIILKENGVGMPINKIVENAQYFPNIIIVGKDDVFLQKRALASLIKKIHKADDKINITVITNGMTKPVGINNINNMKFIINVGLKNSGIEYNKRIDTAVIDWFRECGSLFRFIINTNDDMDEANGLIKSHNLNSRKIYFKFTDSNNIKNLISEMKILKYNIIPKEMII